MRRFVILDSDFDRVTMPDGSDPATPEECVDAINDWRDTYGNKPEDCADRFTIYEVVAEYKFIPPTDKGTITKTEK